MIKYIFCDLDGTIVHDFKNIYDYDTEAIKKIEGTGIKVSIASGRNDSGVKKFNNILNINGFRISQNGAVIINNCDEIEYMDKLTTEEIKKVVEIAKKYPVIYMYESVNEHIVEEKVPALVDFENMQDTIRYTEITDIYDRLDGYDICAMSITAEKYENILIADKMKTELPVGLKVYVSSDYTLDILRDKNSKGNAIKYICDKYNINIDEVAVIGDSYNDISMLKVTKNSFVLHHAHEDVKKHAKYTVKNVKEMVDTIIKWNENSND